LNETNVPARLIAKNVEFHKTYSVIIQPRLPCRKLLTQLMSQHDQGLQVSDGVFYMKFDGPAVVRCSDAVTVDIDAIIDSFDSLESVNAV
jgi:hypothetical protein